MSLPRVNATKPKHRESAMTPTMDVVFQLLAFFILTFRVAAPEGDFGVTMPAASPAPNLELPLVETLHVHLAAHVDGRLADVRVNHRSLGPDVLALHRFVRAVVGVDGPSQLRRDVDAELQFDPHLRYGHAIAALAAVSAHHDAAGNPATLVERVRLVR